MGPIFETWERKGRLFPSFLCANSRRDTIATILGISIMTYITYEAFDKFVTIGPILQKLDFRLADETATWTKEHIAKVKEAANQACDDFKDAFCESVAIVEDYEIDETSYDALVSLYPIIEPFTIPFFELVKEESLENVEKLLCLILFMIHITSYCEYLLSSNNPFDWNYAATLKSRKTQDLDSPADNVLRRTLDVMAEFVASLGVDPESIESEESDTSSP
ncbi:hypothetical protein BKA70DRAFT_692962 [Coprinopsis sp. MPI-PUGE-AT-0042]|nr:hypothetical protein BKA70DRAFT_692962 [Coprinopsis sp. MPI-PUGE-AT-0042]